MKTPHPGLLATEAQIRELAQRLSRETIISFDTEFIRESTFFPMVEIIQVATRDESWLIDAKAFRGPPEKQAGLKAFLDIMRDPKILKILHAAQGDQECLYTAWGALASPSLDTAIAASLCGYGDGIGLGNLLKAVLGVQIKKGHARTDWTVRPLPAQLEEYAHSDVLHLVDAAEKLMSELDKLGRREWAMESSAKYEDPKLYDSDPLDIAHRLAKGGRLDKKGFAALVELVQWREERVRKLNLPRRWVADDNVLVDLAQVRPKDLEHLGSFRGLNKGELKHSGEAILRALERASKRDDLVAPRGSRAEIPTADESQVLDVLKCYVGILADRHRIAAKHLLTSGQLLAVLRSKAKSIDELTSQNLMSLGSAKLIGEEVLALLNGRRAVSIRGGRVDIVEVGET